MKRYQGRRSKAASAAAFERRPALKRGARLLARNSPLSMSTLAIQFAPGAGADRSAIVTAELNAALEVPEAATSTHKRRLREQRAQGAGPCGNDGRGELCAAAGRYGCGGTGCPSASLRCMLSTASTAAAS